MYEYDVFNSWVNDESSDDHVDRCRLPSLHYLTHLLQIVATAPKPKHPHHSGSGSSASQTDTDTDTSTSDTSNAASAGDASSASGPTSHKASKQHKFALSFAAAGAMVAAGLFQNRRRVATQPAHALEGSIAKRMDRMEKFAGPHTDGVRPNLDGGDYNKMPDSAAMV